MATANQLNMSGLAASRPAASIAGRIWFSTDSGQLSYDSGSAWLTIPTGGMSLIQDIIVAGGGAASVHFTSISSAYKHLKLIYRAQVSTAIADLRWVINSDTGTNYTTMLSQGSSTAYTGGGFSGNTYMTLGIADGVGTNAAIFANGVVEIPDYTTTDNFKAFLATAAAHTGTTIAATTAYNEMGLWFNATPAAITDILISAPSGTISAKSRFSLYAYS